MVKIFVSSTIADLNHLRDSIRDLLEELGHQPVMSEYGDFGFLPTASAEQSCYIAMKDCQLAVLIIAKRYSSAAMDGFSVTQNEFKTAIKNQIPIICLIDSEVLAFMRLYEANKSSTLVFPGMDNPEKLFAFINEFRSLPANNGFISYSSVQSAKLSLKKQLSHIFSDLLKKTHNKSERQIEEILSEIVTLRQTLLGDKNAKIKQYIYAYQILQSDSYYPMARVVINIGPLEEEIPKMLEFPTFKDYIKSRNIPIIYMTNEEILEMANVGSTQVLAEKYRLAEYWVNTESFPYLNRYPNSESTNLKFVGPGTAYRVNKAGDEMMESLFSELKRISEFNYASARSS